MTFKDASAAGTPHFEATGSENGRPVEGHNGMARVAAIPEFSPNPLIRPALLQTVLSSRPSGDHLRAVTNEQPIIIDAGPDETGYADRVRLLAYANPQTSGSPSRGLVVTLHGWEGCSHSVFSLVLMQRLLAAGYDVVRLNLRDHGPGYHVDPHALNPGVFLGTLLAEAHRAVQTIATWSGGTPVFVVGPSMGGNFALRMAARHTTSPIPNLHRIVAISPALDPGDATAQIDAHWYLAAYFRPRWINSLRNKQRLFPSYYNFDGFLEDRSLWGITDRLVRRYTPYADAHDYFAHYAVTPQHIVDITASTTILTAADDPVCRPNVLERMPHQPHLKVAVLPYGGHVGFVDAWPLRHRLPDFILDELAA